MLCIINREHISFKKSCLSVEMIGVIIQGMLYKHTGIHDTASSVMNYCTYTFGSLVERELNHVEWLERYYLGEPKT